jgi:hypothetical protein
MTQEKLAVQDGRYPRERPERLPEKSSENLSPTLSLDKERGP